MFTMTLTGALSGTFTGAHRGPHYSCGPGNSDSPFSLYDVEGQIDGKAYQVTVQSLVYSGPGSEPGPSILVGPTDAQPADQYFNFGDHDSLNMHTPTSGTFSMDLKLPSSPVDVHADGSFNC